MLRHQMTRVDLNLLSAFLVLMEEQSVTRAAERLFITQPAMSVKLNRLRELFDDPLFVRTQKGYVPTLKALELVAPIERALEEISDTIFATPFEPASANTSISIQVPDSLSTALIPTLYTRLRTSAPHLKIISDNTTHEYLDLLANGEVDFAIYAEEDYSDEFLSFPIGASPVVCWMRKGHPLQGEAQPSMQQICTYPMVVMLYEPTRMPGPSTSSRIMSRMEQQIGRLYENGPHLDTASLCTSQLLTALATIVRTDALLLGTPFLGELRAHQENLVYRVVSDTAGQTVPLVLIQHCRTANSPLHLWMREQILQSWAGSTEQ